MSVEAAEFTGAMARVPSPVAVVTTVDADGRRWGFTASSFSSLSLQPPLVLVCLDRAASTHGTFVAADRFLVSVLAHDQAGIALQFAKSGADRFEAGDTQPLEWGLPGVPHAAARVACTLHEVFDGGDHSILVGRVEAVHVGRPEPLMYCDRMFVRPAVQ
jgi:flavin reductase (DIM6/NTAB) family NADH-FMN oxidoreductase RutF